MTFEQWLKRPVYVAQCKAWKIIGEIANAGGLNWSVAYKMHMLKKPLSGLVDWSAETTAQHMLAVMAARNAAARLIRTHRRATR